MRKTAVLLSSLLVLPSCSTWFFSGPPEVDRSCPVALVETTGGVELAATTEFGILSLGRTATEGPCRVHYFLGRTPLIEKGELHPTGSVFTAAEIDLKTQHARALSRTATTDDALSVMWTPDGQSIEDVSVELAVGEGLSGDMLLDPGVELPAGATVLCRGPKGESMFAGLIAGRATVHDGPNKGRYYIMAGVDRVRELLAVPRKFPVDMAPKYRTDDITVMKPLKVVAPAAPPAAEGALPIGTPPAGTPPIGTPPIGTPPAAGTGGSNSGGSDTGGNDTGGSDTGGNE